MDANVSDTFSVLDLSSNYLSSSTIYPWLFNFSACLTDIRLSDNELSGYNSRSDYKHGADMALNTESTGL
ncbi:hypothetical protein R6Q57_008580 [Mikania cordata]